MSPDKLTDNYCGCTLIIGNSQQNLQFSNRITYNTNFIHIHTYTETHCSTLYQATYIWNNNHDFTQYIQHLQ